MKRAVARGAKRVGCVIAKGGRVMFPRFLMAVLFCLACAISQSAPVFAKELRLGAGERWLVVASRQDSSEAEDLARSYGLLLNGVRVMRSNNGWFAVVIGPVTDASIGAAKKRLDPQLSLPDDAYLSEGQTYRETVFEAPPSPILAFAAYEGKAPAKLHYGELTVTLDGLPGAEGARVPVATLQPAGSAPLTIRMDDSPADMEMMRWRAQIVRLDPRSPQPAVVLSSYTGGAHCCTATRIATQGGSGLWRVVDAGQLDGDGGYGFEDVAGDGAVELTSIDNSFLYAFASYAESAAPPRVQRLSDGALQDVTQEPATQPYLRRELRRLEAMADKERLWRNNGFLGGWVAAKAQLGEVEEAWKRMLKNYDRKSDWVNEICAAPVALENCPDDKRRKVDFPEALRRHLIAHGYPAPNEAVRSAVPSSARP